MVLANCERCNNVFNRVSIPLCPACVEQDEADLQTVNEALREQPHQTVEQLAERTGVSKKTILRLVKAERIASDADLAKTRCGRCGAPAVSLSLRLCSRCAADMSRAAAQACSKATYGAAGKSSADKDAADMAEDGNESVHEIVERKTRRL